MERRKIRQSRKLTLKAIADEWGVGRERVRQVETKLMLKMKSSVINGVSYEEFSKGILERKLITKRHGVDRVKALWEILQPKKEEYEKSHLIN